jgi:hypothetical protein
LTIGADEGGGGGGSETGIRCLIGTGGDDEGFKLIALGSDAARVLTDGN